MSVGGSKGIFKNVKLENPFKEGIELALWVWRDTKAQGNKPFCL